MDKHIYHSPNDPLQQAPCPNCKALDTFREMRDVYIVEGRRVLSRPRYVCIFCGKEWYDIFGLEPIGKS